MKMRSMIKKVLYFLGKEEKEDRAKEHLSLSDKRWILYWNFMICFGVTALFLLVIGLHNIWVSYQNDKYAEEAMNILIAYMATVTKEEYDEISSDIRHSLVLDEQDDDMEEFVQYIPNNADYCHVCAESYSAQIFLVCVNTGQFYSLDLYENNESPNEYDERTVMSFGYDEVSRSSFCISKDFYTKSGYVELSREHSIVSIHRMKSLFCDDCIRKILDTVKHHGMKGFVILDAEKKKFYFDKRWYEFKDRGL